jgi:hypothetical protein
VEKVQGRKSNHRLIGEDRGTGQAAIVKMQIGQQDTASTLVTEQGDDPFLS